MITLFFGSVIVYHIVCCTEVVDMKIAVTYDNGNVFQHFGRTENFKVYDIENGEIASSQIISSNGIAHEALADMLKEYGVELLICGGMGPGARAALADAGIEVCAGAEGNTDDAVKAYLSGELTGSDAVCDHHDHHHEEEHGCGSEEGCGGCSEEGCGGCPGHCTVEGKNAGRKCTVHYKGTFDDGTQFDSSYDRGQPLEFVCGAGMMIRGFDQAVADMEPGQITDVHLMPEEAYGFADPRMILVLPIADLPGSENLTLGQRVYLSDELGRRFGVTVTEKDETNITLDANHPMAGKELNFRIELISVE